VAPSRGCLLRLLLQNLGHPQKLCTQAIFVCRKVGCGRIQARKAERPMRDCLVAAERRFRRPTPTKSCAARVRSPSTRSRMHLRGSRSSCGQRPRSSQYSGVVYDNAPARIPDQLIPVFLSGSRRDCDSFAPLPNLSGSVTGLPHAPNGRAGAHTASIWSRGSVREARDEIRVPTATAARFHHAAWRPRG
jgi:hypothetical protein